MNVAQRSQARTIVPPAVDTSSTAGVSDRAHPKPAAARDAGRAEPTRDENCQDRYTGVAPNAGSRSELSRVDDRSAISLRNGCAANAVGSELPTESGAVADIKKHLPDITKALNAMVGQKGLSADDAVCDKAAGLVLGKLTELGYKARLVESGMHITVRVETSGNDVIVDPTMSQFFTDGSPSDRLLLAQGGFVGTEKQLANFIRGHHTDWNGSYSPTTSAAEFRAEVEASGPLPESEWREHLRSVFLPDFTAAAMSHFEGGRAGSLSTSAAAVADAYQRFVETGEASDYGRAAYELLQRS